MVLYSGYKRHYVSTRECSHLTLYQINMQTIRIIDLKLCASLSNRVAIARKFFNLAQPFSIKCLNLYRNLSNSLFDLLQFDLIQGL